MVRSRLVDERGAVLAITVLSLIALLGMMVLVIDVGGLLYRRVALQNSSDAGALAAAISCAHGDGETAANAKAEQYVEENSSGATIAPGYPTYTTNCESPRGRVTVRGTVDQQLFFGPVLGSGKTASVTTEATAAWGPLAGGNVVPVSLEKSVLERCGIPDAASGTVCSFWQNNNDLGHAEWSFLNLDLDTWNVAKDFSGCHSESSDTRAGWIENGSGATLMLNGDPPGSLPTYVCAIPGHATSDWQALKNEIGEMKLFPIDDCLHQVDRDGLLAPCPTTGFDKYDVVGFTFLTVVQAYKGDDPLAIGTIGLSGTCATKNNNPVSWTAVGQTLQLNGITTANTGWQGCPMIPPVDNMTSVVVTKAKNNDPACCTLGVDYTYDAATRTITWRGAVPRSTSVRFGWSFNNNAGACGNRQTQSDPNAVCLVLRWDDPQPGSGPIGGGDDFGAPGVVLCDADVPKSCP